MNRIYTLFFLLMLTLSLSAQQDTKAKNILDKTVEKYNQSKGISVIFGGSQSGKLLLKGEKFQLTTQDVTTWFDGQTQWSYLKQNEEVNISTPTPEELRAINPYAWLSLYKQGFNYRYSGVKTREGKQGHEIVLTPQTKQDIQSITLLIGSDYEPIYIGILPTEGQMQEFIVHNYRTQLNLNDNAFRFDKSKYPNAEIIDMR
ncbi:MULTISPECIES: LolA-like putative outer membrane lipoprotein chaperone [Bacteroidaceae]|nr:MULTISPECIES: LolA-like putative outer membrane lipoprotein chaperone [Bacteroidaceae]